jgi:DNA-directed RNA polymerase III subunit RPC6
MEDLILKTCAEHLKIKDSQLNEIISQHKHLDEQQKVQIINDLLIKGKITVSEEDGEVVYNVLSDVEATSMKKLEGSEILILQIIRESSSKGVWNGEIKLKTNIPIQQINKILNNLEKQGLIFSKKSVNVNKKIWFLQGINPSNDVTGGFLFENEEFDNNLMSDLFSQIKLILNEKTSSIKEILTYVKSQVNKNIQEDNLKQVLESLVALNEIEECNGKYKSVKSFLVDPLVVPCIACHMRFECKDDGVINPADCEYLNTWLDF